MAGCCEDKSCALETLRTRQAGVLKIVLAINVTMFIVELISGYMAGSMALMSDSLDMLGDAFVYAFSLYVLNRSSQWRNTAALFKGLIMLAFGMGVLVMAVEKILHPIVPFAQAMGIIGFVVLTANTVCLFLLTRHRHDDLNMSSVWLCSRNDIIANISVLVAAVAVSYTHSIWPDIIVGLIIAVLFLSSAYRVVSESSRELRHGHIVGRVP